MDLLVSVIEQYITYIVFGWIWVIHFFTAWSYRNIRRRQPQKEKNSIPSSCPPVSVIISAHNQARQLYSYLPSILEQDYERFEVIVVNDGSTDETEDVLKHLELKYPQLRHTFVPRHTRHVSHKRLALTIGIKSAQYEWVLFAEPTSRPDSALWIERIAQHFNTGTDMVLGFVHPCQTVSKKIQFHNVYHQLIGMSWAMKNKAYCCNEANVAYRKSFFLEHRGFADDIHLVGGAMTLLVNRHSTRKNTKVALSPFSTMTDMENDDKRTWQAKQMYHTETLRHLQHTFRYRLIYHTKQCSIHCFHICFILTLLWSILQREWVGGAIVLFAYLLLNSIKIVLFNRSCKAINAPTFYFSFIIKEASIIWWNMAAWFRHKKSSNNIYYRKAI